MTDRIPAYCVDDYRRMESRIEIRCDCAAVALGKETLAWFCDRWGISERGARFMMGELYGPHWEASK